jgi:hypothetical protein
MDLKKTGGHAFPTSDVQTAHAIAAAAINGVEDSAERDRVYSDVRAQALQGMTLRDYFAAKIAAAQSVATSADTSYMMPDYAYPDGEQTVAQKIAANAYAVADALLAERAK